MPDKTIFCNTPWYEIHVYWDGSLGICCQENQRLHTDDTRYNIARMSIRDWFNSEPVRQFRMGMLGHSRLPECVQCYAEEDSGGLSRRIRSNSKSVIFTRQAFDQSYQQSPGHKYFSHSHETQGWSDTLPIDIHIDLGNYCNLACKMCHPRASSTIAAQSVKWGIDGSHKYLGTDWTRDKDVWNSFLHQLLDIPNLKNIHVMGGETLLTKRFEDMVDFFIIHDRFDVCFSFVTNGTVYPHDLMIKLARFTRVGIEVSVETMTKHNEYVRQGTSNDLVLQNLERFCRMDNGDNITVTLRSAPSILTIGRYHTLLDYALRNRMIVKSTLCRQPGFLQIEYLPSAVKDLYLADIEQWASTIDWNDHIGSDFNASDSNNAMAIVQEELTMTRSLLMRNQPTDREHQLSRLVRHCERWDKVYRLDARRLYPELSDIFDRYGYAV